VKIARKQIKAVPHKVTEMMMVSVVESPDAAARVS
jgi:hypothetical protein